MLESHGGELGGFPYVGQTYGQTHRHTCADNVDTCILAHKSLTHTQVYNYMHLCSVSHWLTDM